MKNNKFANNSIENKAISQLLTDFPFLKETFSENLIDLTNGNLTLAEALNKFDLEDRTLIKEQIFDLIDSYINNLTWVINNEK